MTYVTHQCDQGGATTPPDYSSSGVTHMSQCGWGQAHCRRDTCARVCARACVRVRACVCVCVCVRACVCVCVRDARALSGDARRGEEILGGSSATKGQDSNNVLEAIPARHWNVTHA